MKYLLTLVFAGLLVIPAAAQPWYARGTFTATQWDTSVEMIDQGGGHYTAAITGLFDNEPHNWKIATADWSINMPASDSRVYTDANGEIHFHLYDNTTWNDGWFPNNVRRVGYNDHNQFDWEVIGQFNNWRNGGEPGMYLTDMGNGLHSGSFTLNTGIYDFKFRRQDDWDVSIGNDFGNGAGNNTIAATADGQQWTFELDLPNGRWRAFTDSTPTLVGDYNNNGTVDAADYAVWRNDPAGHGGSQGYTDWRANFGKTGGQTTTWLLRSPQLPDTPLVSQGGGLYTLGLTGLTPEGDYDLRVFKSDLSATAPGGNAKVRADANGEINVKFYELTSGSWGDGWNPSSAHRFGYEDHGLFDWEIVGGFNGWPGANDPEFALTDQGNGLHTGSFAFDTPGTYPFKFRQIADTNPWNTSIGTDFSNSAPDASFTVASPGQVWNFELDLPNGRWRVYAAAGSGAVALVPEPASLALLMLSAVMLLGVRRK